MKLHCTLRPLVLAILCFAPGLLLAEALTPAQQAKVDGKLAEIKAWAADPAIIKAVVAQNSSLPAACAAMTQEKWKGLSVLDPFVRSFCKNEAGLVLKSRKAAWVGEAFVSDAKGLKVAFTNKTSNWSHGAGAKHTQPMAGKSWQGTVELDESSGLQQLQVSVPVLDGSVPVGSLVVGISLSKLD
ncbi:MAG: hypothetical protein WC661_16355 [Opitutaceae bacterium]|jgi:hypothetical protein